LYVSNNAVIFGDSTHSSVSIGGIGTVMTLSYPGVDISASPLDGEPFSTLLAGIGKAIACTYTNGINVIYYVTLPITSSPYLGGIPAQGGDGGMGGEAVIPPVPDSIGTITYNPTSTSFLIGDYVNVQLTRNGSLADRIHYKLTSFTTSTVPAEGTYTTYTTTSSITIHISSTKKLWARASNGTVHSAWQYETYTAESLL